MKKDETIPFVYYEDKEQEKTSDNVGAGESPGYPIFDQWTASWQAGTRISSESVRTAVSNLYTELRKAQPVSYGSQSQISTMAWFDEVSVTADANDNPFRPANLWDEIKQIRYRLQQLSPASTAKGAMHWWSTKEGASLFDKQSKVLTDAISVIPVENNYKFYSLADEVLTVQINLPEFEQNLLQYDFPECIFLKCKNNHAVEVIKKPDGWKPTSIGTFYGSAMVLFAGDKTGKEEDPQLLPMTPYIPVPDAQYDFKGSLETKCANQSWEKNFILSYPSYIFNKTEKYTWSISPTSQIAIFNDDLVKKLNGLPFSITVTGDDGLQDTDALEPEKQWTREIWFGTNGVGGKWSIRERGKYSFIILGTQAFLLSFDTVAGKAYYIDRKRPVLENPNAAIYFREQSTFYPTMDGDKIGDETDGNPFDGQQLVLLYRNETYPTSIQWWNEKTSAYDTVNLETDYTYVVGGPEGAVVVWQYDIPPLGFTEYKSIDKDATCSDPAMFYSIDTSATLSPVDTTQSFVEKEALLEVYNRGSAKATLGVRIQDGADGTVVKTVTLAQPYSKVMLYPDKDPVVVMSIGSGSEAWTVKQWQRCDGAGPFYDIAETVVLFLPFPVTLNPIYRFCWDINYFKNLRRVRFMISGIPNYSLPVGWNGVSVAFLDPASNVLLQMRVCNNGEVWSIVYNSATKKLDGALLELGVSIDQISLSKSQVCGVQAAQYTLTYAPSDPPATIERANREDPPGATAFISPFDNAVVQFVAPQASAANPVKLRYPKDAYIREYGELEIESLYSLYRFSSGHEPLLIKTGSKDWVVALSVDLQHDVGCTTIARTVVLHPVENGFSFFLVWPPEYFDEPKYITFRRGRNDVWPTTAYYEDVGYHMVNILFTGGFQPAHGRIPVWNDGETWCFQRSGNDLLSELCFEGFPRPEVNLTKKGWTTGYVAQKYNIQYPGFSSKDKPTAFGNGLGSVLGRLKMSGGSWVPEDQTFFPSIYNQAVRFSCPDIGTGSRFVSYVATPSRADDITIRNPLETWIFNPWIEPFFIYRGSA